MPPASAPSSSSVMIKVSKCAAVNTSILNIIGVGVLSGLLENRYFQEQFGDPRPVVIGITVASYCTLESRHLQPQ